MKAAPDWDLLITANVQDLQDYVWFPCGKARTVEDLISLEGMRPRNTYVTSKAIEAGSAALFHHLYFNARITGGKVLHVTDYRESE